MILESVSVGVSWTSYKKKTFQRLSEDGTDCAETRRSCS